MDSDSDATPVTPPHHNNGPIPIALIAGVGAASLFLVCLLIFAIGYVVLRRRRRTNRFKAAKHFVSARGCSEFKQPSSDEATLLGSQKFEYAHVVEWSSQSYRSVSGDDISKASPEPTQSAFVSPPLEARNPSDTDYGYSDGIPGRIILSSPSPKIHLPSLSIPKQLPALPLESAPSPDSPASTASIYSQVSAATHMHQMIEKEPHNLPPCPPLPPQFSSMLQQSHAPNGRITYQYPSPLVIARPVLPPHNEALDSQLQSDLIPRARADPWIPLPPVLPLQIRPSNVQRRPESQPEYKPLHKVDTTYISQLVKARMSAASSTSSRHLHLRDSTNTEVAQVCHPSFPSRVQSSHFVIETIG
jgi:hypothetical protein